jgi:hypothetical protein
MLYTCRRSVDTHPMAIVFRPRALDNHRNSGQADRGLNPHRGRVWRCGSRQGSTAEWGDVEASMA